MTTTPPDRAPGRWQWRTFAASLADLEARLGSAAGVSVHETAGVQILVARDDLDLRICDGALDLACLETTDAAGLEFWRPAGQVRFPATAEAVAGRLAPFGLGLPLDGQVTREAFLQRMSERGQFQIVDVIKSVRRFPFMGCIANVTRMATNGRPVESFCIDSDDPRLVLAALRELGLSPAANTGVPRGLKRQLGPAPAPAEPATRSTVEIERKFLVDTSRWRPSAPGVDVRQGYLSSARERVVRVRIAGEKAWLTIKSASVGITRDEFEYEIPVADAAVLLENLCEQPVIAKTRYREHVGGRIWEVDVFHGDNEGLVVAEIELRSENEPFDKPDWAIREVSGDPRYFNSSLVATPYKDWQPAGG